MSERPSIDAVLQRVSVWKGRDTTVTQLAGLTNENYIVLAGEERWVVRIPGQSTELLAVDRENERRNAEAAATTGISPRIVEYIPEWSVMVLEFIDGETMSGERLRGPEMPGRIASSLRRLHAGPRFHRDFDMFRLVEYYLQIADQQGVTIPSGFMERMPTVAEVERVVGVNKLPTVPSHNDLLAENYIDDGRQLWIIDFEYSGNNDPCFELGDTAQESEYDEELRSALCEAYFGRPEPVQLARMELHALMADVGWTLWAAIQTKISAIDYDFWGWAEERWARAIDVIEGQRFGALLSQAASA